MRLFAIADLHLDSSGAKNMDVFGASWENHTQRLQQEWTTLVDPEDLVLIAGDTSWAMKLAEALDDLNWLDRLPGKKVLIRGNHDYWWQGISKLRAALPPSLSVIQNDHYPLPGGRAVCGSRGWTVPGHSAFLGEQDQTIYDREVIRLELSIQSALKAGLQPAIVMLHFPPFAGRFSTTAFTELLEQHHVRLCIFGHLHGRDTEYIWQGRRNEVTYQLVSADYLSFRPLYLGET